jgi:hypothetical protein
MLLSKIKASYGPIRVCCWGFDQSCRQRLDGAGWSERLKLHHGLIFVIAHHCAKSSQFLVRTALKRDRFAIREVNEDLEAFTG